MKVLITGGSGQLGTELRQLLQARGDEVIAPGRDELDLLQPDDLAASILRHRPNWVVNCAAYTQVDRAEDDADSAFRINRDAARALAQTCRQADIHLAHISTDFIFDGRQSTPYDEQAIGNPLGIYGDSKWQGEQAVIAEKPDALVLRIAWVYGCHGNNFVKTMLRLATEREELRVVCDQIGTPGWTHDIADALQQLIAQDAQGIYHFSNEGVASWYDFACAIVEEACALGYALKVRQVTPIASEEFPTPARRPAYSVLDKRKIRPRLDGPIPHWRSSLRRMLTELKEAEVSTT